jgi:hypothetical protein
MHPLDTSTTALQRQRETFRRMTPEQRPALAAEMSDEIRAALVVILLGRDQATRGRARRTAAR